MENLQEEMKKRIPTVPLAYPDNTRATSRVTSTLCESDGGNFFLIFAELRPVQAWTGDDRYAGNSGYVEVGRFVLSSVALQHLKKAIAEAEQYHIAHFGPMPDLDTFYHQLMQEIPERPAEVEQRMGFR